MVGAGDPIGDFHPHRSDSPDVPPAVRARQGAVPRHSERPCVQRKVSSKSSLLRFLGLTDSDVWKLSMFPLIINFTLLTESLFYGKKNRSRGRIFHPSLQEIIFLIRRLPHISDFPIVLKFSAVICMCVFFLIKAHYY